MVYKKATLENKIIEKYYDELRRSDPLLGQIKMVKIIHSGGFLYEQQKSRKQHISELKKLSTSAIIKKEMIIDYKIEEFSNLLFEFVNQQLMLGNEMIIKEVERVCNFTGNIFHRKNKVPTYQEFTEMIEKIEIRFDKNGNPILPVIFCGLDLFEKMKTLKSTKEEKQDFDKMLKNKKEKWYAKKHYRKLSYLD